jgi:hypothetical protein
VSQYTTQLLIPEVDACVDLIQHTNYSIPTLQYGSRVLIERDRNVALGDAYEFTEADYVDGYEPETYTLPDAEFNATLNSEQVQRLNKINELLRRFVNGLSVSDKQLKSVLDAEQYSEYTNALTTQKHLSEINYGDGEPSALRPYKAWVKQGDFEYNKYERMSSSRSSGRAKYKSQTIDRVYNKSDGFYERALECLEELWGVSSGYEQHQIQKWMDRDIDFDAGVERKIGIGPVLIPRVRGSRSSNALDSGLPKLSKRLKRKECQLLALRDAAWKLAFKPEDEAEVSAEVELKLRERIARMKASKNLFDERD